MRCRKLLAIVLILLARAPSLEAQRLVSLALGGGASFPQGDLHSGTDIGWNALASLVVNTPMQPLGLRVDAAYNQFPFNADVKTVLGSGNNRVASATLNATYRLPTPGSPMSPYIIAGLGAYRTDCSVDPGCDAVTRFGWNAGLGTRFYALGFRSFLEARYHATKSDGANVHYFPVTFGIMF